MKKAIYNTAVAAACLTASTLLTGCLEEVLPTQGVTQEQLNKSPKAGEALLWGMPAYLNSYDLLNMELAYDHGYPSIMHIRDVMTNDMPIYYSTYDWYPNWEYNTYLGPDYVISQLTWTLFSKIVQTANKTIGNFDPDDSNEIYRAYCAMGRAFRAFAYIDMARMYEFLPNDKISSTNVDGNDVLNLTVPIVTEATTEEQSKNNPRATRQQMFEFILSDLDYAEANIEGSARLSKTLPDLSVVYGLKARLYMWVEDYANARIYARKAIDTGIYTPTTADQWHSTTSGFNDLSTPSWMFGGQCMKDDASVQSALFNWTSWNSNETTYGYAGIGPFTMADVNFYNRISDNDFRKLTWKAPEGSALSGKEQYLDQAMFDNFPELTSLKFRPGDGNTGDYLIGSATAYPLMRIEEMYFIEAEAAAHINPSEGKSLVESFMRAYRNGSYSCRAADVDGVVEEIVFQKRVELWGEGQTFFDVKRLNMSVTRRYEGTNFSLDAQMNTQGRPAWMNFVFNSFEGNSNKGVDGWNNPDPSDCYEK